MFGVRYPRVIFPAADSASRAGVVAVGGAPTPPFLLSAYRAGVFPWPVLGQPLLWHSPNPRFVLLPSEAHVGKSLRKTIKQQKYRITFDQEFAEVVRRCSARPRPGQSGTWITPAMIDGYTELHRLGVAHSVEAWIDDALVGGLYGVAVGAGFAGESMFASQPDASKVAFATLLANLARWDYAVVDCQVYTDHLERFGAFPLPRAMFVKHWARVVDQPVHDGAWRDTAPIDDIVAFASRSNDHHNADA